MGAADRSGSWDAHRQDEEQSWFLVVKLGAAWG